MPDKYIQGMVNLSKKLSEQYGACWLFSNGQKLETAINASEYCTLKDSGYWVAMLFDGGHQVDI